jgi:hypothetical protein
MANRPKQGPRITYEIVQGLTDLTIDAIHQAGARPKPGVKRQHLDLSSLESIVLWVAAHGHVDLRRKICGYAAQSLLDDGVLQGAPKKPRSSSSDRQ